MGARYPTPRTGRGGSGHKQRSWRRRDSTTPAGWREGPLAGLAMIGVLATIRAELLQVEPVRVVAPVLLGDVVAVLAYLTRQGDLRSYVGGCHFSCLSCDRARY